MASARESTPFTVNLLSPEQLACLLAGLATFPPRVRQEGNEYAASGRVAAIDYDGHCAAARVRGALDYFSQWEWVDDDWRPLCSCPDGPECKHTYALGRAMLGSTRATQEPGLTLPTRFPVTTAPTAAATVTPTATPTAAAGHEEPLLRMRQTRDLRLRQDLLARLVQEGPRLGVSPFDPELQTILREADADLLCWRLAQDLYRRLDGWVPASLAPYLYREDLERRFTMRARALLARDLAAWGTQRAQVGRRGLRVLLHLETTESGQPRLRVDARVTTPKLQDVRRTTSQLSHLRNEVRRSPHLLPMDQAVLLEWLVDVQIGGSDAHLAGLGFDPRYGLWGKQLLGFLARAAGSPLVTWARGSDADLMARAGVTAGTTIALEHSPVRLLPTVVIDGDDLGVDLAFHLDDGRRVRLADALYFHGPSSHGQAQPSFLLANGAFHPLAEEPPQPLVENFARTGGLHIQPEERREMLNVLSESFPHLKTTIGEHTHFYAVRSVVALDLREDDWMQVRLFAHTGDEPWRPGEPITADRICFEYDPQHGWTVCAPDTSAAPTTYESLPETTTVPEAVDASPVVEDAIQAEPAPVAEAPPPPVPVTTDLWFTAPAAADVEAAVSWLRRLGAHPGTQRSRGGATPSWPDAAQGWWTHAGRKRMQDFGAAWEERPASVAFYGNDRLRRLLTGQIRISPRVRISATGVDWFSVTSDWVAQGMELTEDDVALLRTATTRFVKLSAGWVDRDQVTMDDETTELLADLGLELDTANQRVTLWQLAGARPESLEALARLGADPETVAAAELLRQRVAEFSGLPAVDVPAGLQAELRDYQKRGLDFLAYTADIGVGAVLADDMGLGKTVQALAWLLHLRERDPEGGPCLVVCPASVVHNWEREAQRFAPALRCLTLTSGHERHELRRGIRDYDLVLTNYALLRIDIDEWRETKLRAVILDEAQNIKNPDAAVTQAAMALPARHRLALTGTPLENRALDLWSIVGFVNPDYLGPRSRFQLRYDRPDAPPHVRILLAAKLRPMMLRRSKRQVATELPDRIEERQDCELTSGQRALYVAELQRSRELVQRLSGEPGGIAQNKIHILAALTRLRQICCHPALAGGRRELGSGKFDALFELLEPLLAEGHKVLVFSQFVECLRLLKQEMTTRGIQHHMLTGQSTKREQIVAGFQEDPNPCVFLVSLKAGGTGLNLTAASYVVLFDPWWNPAVEAQAIDRTHRIGQDKTVIAYRMLATGTIEEKIFDLQQRKAALVRDILGEGGFARALTSDDLDFLLAEA